jgi:elongation factor Ts
MDITSEMVRALRERTGAGLMECKRALEAAQADIEAAVDHLRKSGLKTAEKKAERETGEGRVRVHVAPKARVGSIVALSCETDFVAKTADFEALARDLAEHVAEKNPPSVEALLEQPFRGGKASVGEALKLLVGKIGENMRVARFTRLENMSGRVGAYIHHDGKKGALVSVTTQAEEGVAAEALKELAMHVVVFNPTAAKRQEVTADLVQRERAIYLEEVKSKPPEMQEKIVAGKLEKFYADQVLPEQKWMKDDTKTVQQIVEEKLGKGSRIEAFARFQIGK